mgnify:FL=1
MPHRPYRLSAAVLAASLSQLGLAATPTKLEEIRVTGEPMQRSSLETISSISIVSEQEIEARNIRDLYDLLLRTPNVNAAKEDKFSVRGISNEGIGPGGAGRPTVSVFIDGARAPGRGVGNTWDVEQVEFYRGPQSTAFGPGSLAGAIFINTRDPGDELNGQVKAGVSNYGGQEAGIAVGGALGGGFSARYAGETNHSDGEVTNTTLNDDEWQARTRYLQRAKLGWAGDRYQAMLNVQSTKLREGNEYIPPATAEQRISTDNVDGYYLDDTLLVSLNQQLQIGETSRLEWILSHSDSYNRRKGDYDVSADDNGFFVNTTDATNNAAELLFHIDRPGLRAVVGAYYAEDTLDGSSRTEGLIYSISGLQVRAFADLLAKREAETQALYAEADIDLSQSLTLTLGARYEENDADNRSAFIVDEAYPVDPITGTTLPTNVGPVLAAVLDSDATAPNGDEVWLPKLALSYQITDVLSAFITHSYGYRAGSVDFVSDGQSPTYGPEYTKNWDLGLKYQGERWYVQGSLFRVDYDDMQIGVRVDASTFRTDNAGEARAQGIELEFRGELLAGLSLFGGVGYTDTEFVDYIDEEESFNGKHFPNAPRLTATLGLNYQHSSGLFADLSWSRSENSFTDRENTPTLMADARDLFSARLGWQNDSWRAELYGKNLTDTFYVTDRFNNPSLGIDAVFVGDPKEYGARLSYRF